MSSCIFPIMSLLLHSSQKAHEVINGLRHRFSTIVISCHSYWCGYKLLFDDILVSFCVGLSVVSYVVFATRRSVLRRHLL